MRHELNSRGFRFSHKFHKWTVDSITIWYIVIASIIVIYIYIYIIHISYTHIIYTHTHTHTNIHNHIFSAALASEAAEAWEFMWGFDYTFTNYNFILNNLDFLNNISCQRGEVQDLFDIQCSFWKYSWWIDSQIPIWRFPPPRPRAGPSMSATKSRWTYNILYRFMILIFLYVFLFATFILIYAYVSTHNIMYCMHLSHIRLYHIISHHITWKANPRNPDHENTHTHTLLFFARHAGSVAAAVIDCKW